jgi:hypothetical protein
MENPPSTKEAGDIAREVGKTIVSAIPTLGGPLQVLFENVFSAPIEKRKQAWLEQLVEVVTELQRRVEGLTTEKLATNETFITVAMQASQMAVRNHQKEKLQALRNAVLNSALPNPPQEDEQMIFLRLIDQLTPWHLRVLGLLNNPVEWMKEAGLLIRAGVWAVSRWSSNIVFQNCKDNGIPMSKSFAIYRWTG